ncbi:MAG: DNA mismatch repair protein MutS, partial [Kiritimatiellae bacterium]|nr:DNA mismatch repair protein MutS [Kiritimatiellia bacterium]
AVPALRDAFSPVLAVKRDSTLERLFSALDPMQDLADDIDGVLSDEPPASISDGGTIRAGFSRELDDLRAVQSDGRAWIATFQASEAARTGIKNLRIRYNRVFGYYIEVTTSQLPLVPPDYVRRQTIAGGERFTTPALKEREALVSGAEEKALALEQEIFDALRARIVARTGEVQSVARAAAELDALRSFADRAIALGYARPVVDDSDALEIRGGRHPILEQLPEAERFVPNDTVLNGSSRQIVLVTGPNMAGKSTYLRQTALIALMAQCGSFVPADSARIGLVDRIFTRVGASDDMARGRSTFLVEMQETAAILNNATPRSLVVLDEIGRGTSTFDGISIAWAVAEFLHDTPGAKARTLFATHYHELADLALSKPGIVNASVLVRERGDSVVFLRRVVDGPADKSYGIAVAKLAGMPAPVISRAKQILANLESNEIDQSTGQASFAAPRRPAPARAARTDGAAQLELSL